MFIVDLIEYLFSNKKKLIYSTFNMDDYYRVVAKLKADSVKYRVSTYADSRSWGHQNNQYKIYVKKSDQHKAMQALNQNK